MRHPQRQAGPARADRRLSRCRSSPNSPCRGRAGGADAAVAGDGRAAGLRLSALIARPSRTGAATTVLDQVETGDADDFGPVTVPDGPCVRDGRQSRRQPRQPLSASTRGGIGFVPIENVVGRALSALLVDRRQRLVDQAADLVHRAARPTASARTTIDERARRLHRAKRSATSPATPSCSSAR